MIIVWIAVSIVGLVVFLWFFPVTLWFQALISGVRISLIQLVLMRWRGVSPNTIVMAMVTGTKAGLKLYKWASSEKGQKWLYEWTGKGHYRRLQFANAETKRRRRGSNYFNGIV